MKILGNAAVFIICYIVLMIPTYVLPYFGSNSTMFNSLGAASNLGPKVHTALFIHMAFLAGLVLVAWFRGALIGKKWLVSFPVIAALFDLLPVLSVIPFVSTVFHLLTLILGVVGTTSTAIRQPEVTTK